MINDFPTLSLDQFRRDLASIVERVRKTRTPQVVTEGGEHAAVLVDAGTWRMMLERLELVGSLDGIRQGLEDVADGRHEDASAAFADIRARLGIDGSRKRIA